MDLMESLRMRAWESDTQEKLGGWMDLAGIDVQAAFMPRRVRDHPAMNQTFDLPYGRGTVTNVITHPRGRLLFDVDFADGAYKRYFGDELADVLEGKPEHGLPFVH